MRSGTNPLHVSVVEAHGTGTQVGDKCEIESVGLVFGSAERSLPVDQGDATGPEGRGDAEGGPDPDG